MFLVFSLHGRLVCSGLGAWFSATQNYLLFGSLGVICIFSFRFLLVGGVGGFDGDARSQRV